MIRKFSTVAAVVSMVAGCLAAGNAWASDGVVPANAGAPAVMVTVESTTPPADMIVVTYAVPVSDAQIRDDAAAMSRNAGWIMDSLQIEAGSNPESIVSHSAVIVTSNAIDRSSGRLPVAPLVNALRRYGQIELAFDVAGPFSYLGNRSYSDQSVEIAMEPQSPGSITYAFRVNVKEPPRAAANENPGRSLPWRRLSIGSILAALAVAFLAGLGAYLLILRLLLRAGGSAGS